jgi:DNA-binding beta-propeller fold protein YncE
MEKARVIITLQRRLSMRQALFTIALCFVGSVALLGQVTTAATFGTVVPLGGTPSDMVMDETRQQIYLVNSAKNRVDIFSMTSQIVTRSIGVGNAPLAVALSMDGAFLYVTNSRSSSMSVISLAGLGGPALMQNVSLPAIPEGVAVGADGRVLVSTQAANSLLIYDQNQVAGAQLTPVTTPPPPSTPAPLPNNVTTRPQTAFNSKLIRTPDGTFIIGLTNPGNNGANTYLFVYEVASGTILRSRQVAGQSTTLSISPDGSRFMAGYTLYDTATLNVVAQQNNANAPFNFANTFSASLNVGGSVFSPDGTLIYSAFNVAAFVANPPPAPISSTLLINDSRNLGIQLGIRMPESIVSKMLITADGTQAWSLSTSGLIYLPLSTLYNHPIIQPETTQVFLSSDPCNRGIAGGSLMVNNIGKGKLTFSVTSTHSSLSMQASSGLAPSTLNFTMDPGRTGVNRQSGTNLTTGGETLQGNPVDIVLSSNEAINIPNTIRVYMNKRDPDQAGIVYPVPTAPNNSPGSAANPTFAGGNEGLQDIIFDSQRNLVYISNSGYNRLEVFDAINKVFLNPISVGQLPHQMAMSTDNTTLYVGNTGGELISIVDLSQNPPVQTGYIILPAYPRQAGGTNSTLINPRSLAYGLFGLEFIMSNGGQWKLVANNTATVRPADNVTSTTAGSSLFTAPTTMVASSDASTILTLSGNGNGYLYDAVTDSYVGASALFGNNLTGYFGPIAAQGNASYLLAGGEVLNSSLTVIAGVPSAGATQRPVAALAAYDANNYISFTTSFRGSIASTSADEQRPTLLYNNIPSVSTSLVAVAPEQPRYTGFGTTRLNIPARLMAIDIAGGNAYMITLSGLSVMPLNITGAPTPAITTPRSVINSADGTTTIRPGSFVTISGSNLAGSATPFALPAPTVLGGSCVTFNDVSLPLFQTGPDEIQAQIPANIVTGTNVVVVRSLANGTYSNPVVVTVSPVGN